MSEFDPGPGWRHLRPDDGLGPAETYLVLHEPDGDTHFIWEEPVVLPTEPGTVIAIGEWWLVLLEPYEGLVDADAWELLPARSQAVRRSIESAGAHQQCVYGSDWVRAEAAQNGGFEVLSRPVKAVAAEVLADVRKHAESRGEDPDHELFGLAKIGAKWGLS